MCVDGSGTVTIIDYGLAGKATPDSRHGGLRGGIDFFMEPEVASARLAGRPEPALSLRGEQYSLGALLYLVLTGAHTHAFSLEHEEMLRQLLATARASFPRSSGRSHACSTRTLPDAIAPAASCCDPSARRPPVISNAPAPG